MMYIWVIESWDNALTPSKDGDFHDTHLAYIAGSEDVAKEYCRTHQDYAGRSDFWHWRIFPCEVSTRADIDMDQPYGEHWLRDMSAKCDPDGKPKEDFEAYSSGLDNYDLQNRVIDLEGCKEEDNLRIGKLEDSLTEVLSKLEELKEQLKEKGIGKCRLRKRRKK